MTELETLRKAMQEIFDLTHQDNDARAEYCRKNGIPADYYYPYVHGAISYIADAAFGEIGGGENNARTQAAKPDTTENH